MVLPRFLLPRKTHFRPTGLSRRGIAAVLLAVCFAAAVRAESIVYFSPIPPTAGFPELTFGPGGLQVGIGAQGTGDGNLPVSSQHAGGLEINTPLTMPFAPARGQVANVDGSTTFYDATLTLSGLSPSGPATVSGPLIAQPLNGGTFDLYSTAAFPTLGTLLLSGTFSNATIDAINGTSSGDVLSGTITYTGGLIYSQIIAHGGIAPGDSAFSYSLNSTSNFSQNGSTHFLNSFNADATGLFSANLVPEPASFILFGLGIIGLVAVARRRR